MGDLVSRNVPTLVSLEGIIDMGGGDGFSLVLTNTYQVYSFGNGGLIGLGNIGDVKIPTLISYLTGIRQICAGRTHSFALTQSGQVYGFGANPIGQLGFGDTKSRSTPELITSLSGVTRMLHTHI